MYLQFACYLIYSRMKQQSTRNELKISTRKMEKQTSSAHNSVNPAQRLNIPTTHSAPTYLATSVLLLCFKL